ncbi:MAG: helix-turn-helix domain-containing protein [Cyanobacteria bacterium P01_E01_bin.34]
MDPNIYQIVEPIAELRPYIRRLLVADSPVAVDRIVRPAPTGYNYLGWAFAGTGTATVNEQCQYLSSPARLHFSGQIQYQDIAVHHTGRLGHILAECTATGFYELTGIPGERILATSGHLDEVDPELAAPIDRVLATFANPDDSGDRTTHRLKIFQQQLCVHANNALSVPDYISKTVIAIENADGCLKVSDVFQAVPASARQIRRKFKEIVGVSPKYFAKVLQINKALLALYAKDEVTLSTLAQEAGFYDQAHFVHAMQQFFTTSPRDFLESSEPLLSTFLGQSRRNLSN